MSENCLKAACEACDITFAVAPLPMDITSLHEKMMAAKCPECGAGVSDLKLDASEAEPDYPLAGSPNQHG